MADLSVTAASVLPGANAQTSVYPAAGTITAGEVVYINSTGQAALANATTSILTANAYGVALNGGAVGQPITVQFAGDITIGATLTIGVIYFPSTNNGGICAAADITATSDYQKILGMAVSTSNMTLVLRGASTLVLHG